MKVAAVIPVAGFGKRFSSKIPKQYQVVAGKPLLAATLDKILTVGVVNQIVVVFAPNYKQEIEKIINMYAGLAGELLYTSGGATRQDSVYNGLQKVDKDTDVVMIHDGVRPLITKRMITESIEMAVRMGACITALPVHDTIKRVQEGVVIETVPREDLWQVQTPQTFRYSLLMDIHEKAKTQKYYGTDDASLAEWLDIPVHVTLGEETNIKITTPADMEYLKFILENKR
jgi:2-C-methyl-D-erythritol 4-phosphate cytidylyltransferase